MHDKKLFARWEKRLANFGLAKRQLDVIREPGHVISASAWKSKATQRVAYEELVRFHEVAVEAYPRHGHDWANSNAAVRSLLLHLYPHLLTQPYQRNRAATTCLLIYRYFRLCEPTSSIAHDLRIPIKTLETRIERIKRLALTLCASQTLEELAA